MFLLLNWGGAGMKCCAAVTFTAMVGLQIICGTITNICNSLTGWCRFVLAVPGTEGHIQDILSWWPSVPTHQNAPFIDLNWEDTTGATNWRGTDDDCARDWKKSGKRDRARKKDGLDYLPWVPPLKPRRAVKGVDGTGGAAEVRRWGTASLKTTPAVWEGAAGEAGRDQEECVKTQNIRNPSVPAVLYSINVCYCPGGFWLCSPCISYQRVLFGVRGQFFFLGVGN